MGSESQGDWDHSQVWHWNLAKKTMARSQYGVEKWARVTALMILDAEEMLRLCPGGTNWLRYLWKGAQASGSMGTNQHGRKYQSPSRDWSEENPWSGDFVWLSQELRFLSNFCWGESQSRLMLLHASLWGRFLLATSYSTSPSDPAWSGGQEELCLSRAVVCRTTQRCTFHTISLIWFFVKSDLAGSNFFPCASHILCSVPVGLL